MLPPTVPNGFNEWPSIEFPQWLQDLGFEDYSYHNDLCARAQKNLTPEAEEQEFPVLVAWCEHKKLEDREMRDSPAPENSIFHVYLHFADAPCSDNDSVLIYQGDDAAACESAIRDFLATHVAISNKGADGVSISKIVEQSPTTLWALSYDESWRSYDIRKDGSVRYRKSADGVWVNDDGEPQIVTFLAVKEGTNAAR